LERNGFGLRGCLSVYRVAALGFLAVNDPEGRFPQAIRSGVALFGQEELSFPAEEVLTAYLSPEEQTAIGLWDLRNNPALDAYLTTAQTEVPLFREDLAAVLGGWHTSWPDGPPNLPRLRELNERIRRAGGPGVMPAGTTFRCEPYRLLLWTLRDAEPWVEVWGDDAGELHGVARIT
jgi:hypothetical protein